ncbi:unnamed protein product, partial [Prorocentrum cordatum]
DGSQLREGLCNSLLTSTLHLGDMLHQLTLNIVQKCPKSSVVFLLHCFSVLCCCLGRGSSHLCLPPLDLQGQALGLLLCQLRVLCGLGVHELLDLHHLLWVRAAACLLGCQLVLQ